MSELMIIEGRKLGNGKTLSMVIAAYKFAMAGKKILTNIGLTGISHTRILREKDMFDAEDAIIILDEADKYVGIDIVIDGKMFYENLIKTARKQNLDIFLITQRAGLIQRRVRLMATAIAIPSITHLAKRKIRYNYRGREIFSKVTPRSVLLFPVFTYQESKVDMGKYENLVLEYVNKYRHLPYYFRFYDTRERPPEIDRESIIERRRKTVENGEVINIKD